MHCTNENLFMPNTQPKIKIYLLNDKYKNEFWVPVSDYYKAIMRIRNVAMKIMNGGYREDAYNECLHQLDPYGLKHPLDILSFKITDVQHFIHPKNIPSAANGVPCLTSICDELAWGVEKYGHRYIAVYNHSYVNDHKIACEICDSIVRSELSNNDHSATANGMT